MKLIKKKLLELPIKPLPKDFIAPQNGRQYDFIYTAALHGETLALELYTPESVSGEEPKYRVFCTESGWINYDTENKKWNKSTLDYIGKIQSQYWQWNGFYPAQKEDEKAANPLEARERKPANTIDHIKSTQQRIKTKQEAATIQRRRQEQEQTFDSWPDLPTGWQDRLKNGAWDNRKYCFYQKTPKSSVSMAAQLIEKELPGSIPKYSGICTHCGKSFALNGPLWHTAGKPTEAGSFTCPECGAKLHPKKSGLGRGQLYDSGYLLLGTEREGKIYLDLIHASRNFIGPPFGISIIKTHRWLLDTKNETAVMWEKQGGDRWVKKPKAAGPPAIHYKIDESAKAAIMSTRLRYGLQLLSSCELIRAAAELTKHPALEMVYKMGNSRWAIESIYYSRKSRKAINLKGKTMCEVLGLNRAELKFAKKHCRTTAELFVYQQLIKEGKQPSVETMETVKNIYDLKK